MLSSNADISIHKRFKDQYTARIELYDIIISPIECITQAEDRLCVYRGDAEEPIEIMSTVGLKEVPEDREARVQQIR